MLKHPDVQRKAQHELDTVLKGSLPTFEDQDSLPYMMALVMETLRWNVAAPFGRLFTSALLPPSDYVRRCATLCNLRRYIQWLLHSCWCYGYGKCMASPIHLYLCALTMHTELPPGRCLTMKRCIQTHSNSIQIDF